MDYAIVGCDYAARHPEVGARIRAYYEARHDARLQDDVRACLTRMNVRWHELSERREGTTFCGTWLNNPPAPDCVELAPRTFSRLEEVRELLPPDEQEERMRRWCEQYPTDEVAVYCNGCERGVALGGRRPVQVLELLFPPPATPDTTITWAS